MYLLLFLIGILPAVTTCTFDWESEHKKQIETYFDMRVKGNTVKENEANVLPLLEKECGNICSDFLDNIAGPLMNVDVWIWNLFERKDCKIKKVNAVIKFLLNDVCAKFHHRQVYNFMLTTIKDQYSTGIKNEKKATAIGHQLKRQGDFGAKYNSSTLKALLPIASHYQMTPCDVVEKYINTTPRILFKEPYSGKLCTVSDEHREELACWAVRQEKFPKLKSESLKILYNRGDIEVLKALAEKDPTIAQQVAEYEKLPSDKNAEKTEH